MVAIIDHPSSLIIMRCVSLVAPSSQSAVSGGNTAKTSHHRMMHDRIYIHHVLDTTSTTRAEGISQELA